MYYNDARKYTRNSIPIKRVRYKICRCSSLLQVSGPLPVTVPISSLACQQFGYLCICRVILWKAASFRTFSLSHTFFKLVFEECSTQSQFKPDSQFRFVGRYVKFLVSTSIIITSCCGSFYEKITSQRWFTVKISTNEKIPQLVIIYTIQLLYILLGIFFQCIQFGASRILFIVANIIEFLLASCEIKLKKSFTFFVFIVFNS